jgi:hypothetical protein
VPTHAALSLASVRDGLADSEFVDASLSIHEQLAHSYYCPSMAEMPQHNLLFLVDSCGAHSVWPCYEE